MVDAENCPAAAKIYLYFNEEMRFPILNSLLHLFFV